MVIIGGGFGGLLAGARLREAGRRRRPASIEKGGDFGGTWYWNRYPGAQCDVESYIYLPLLEEIGYMPKEKYSRASEILEHCRAIGRHFGLYDGACFQTEVTGMRWDEATGRWIVSTNRGDELRARFVCMANGPLHRPKLPGDPRHRDVRGPHVPHQPLGLRLHRRRLRRATSPACAASVSGSSAPAPRPCSACPTSAPAAEQLYVFQRTPSSIDVRNNRPTDPEWAASLEPGWQKRRMENFNTLVSGGFEPEDLVNDGWTDIIGKLLVRDAQRRRQPT